MEGPGHERRMFFRFDRIAGYGSCYHPVRLRTIARIPAEVDRSDLHRFRRPSWKPDRAQSGSRREWFRSRTSFAASPAYKLGDVRRVSELAEITVHKLWERHGEDAGIWPWRRVLVRAMWEARDMAAGDSQWRIKHTVPLALGLA